MTSFCFANTHCFGGVAVLAVLHVMVVGVSHSDAPVAVYSNAISRSQQTPAFHAFAFTAAPLPSPPASLLHQFHRVQQPCPCLSLPVIAPCTSCATSRSCAESTIAPQPSTPTHGHPHVLQRGCPNRARCHRCNLGARYREVGGMACN